MRPYKFQGTLSLPRYPLHCCCNRASFVRSKLVIISLIPASKKKGHREGNALPLKRHLLELYIPLRLYPAHCLDLSHMATPSTEKLVNAFMEGIYIFNSLQEFHYSRRRRNGYETPTSRLCYTTSHNRYDLNDDVVHTHNGILLNHKKE